MKTSQFKAKYEALQEEAKSLANELRPLAKKFKSLSKRAAGLGSKANTDKGLYRPCGTTDDSEPDRWNIHVLFRLTDFEDYSADDYLIGAMNLLLNLVDEPFDRRDRK